jgi:predicted short-subunit dehydrogenase-like oxidoreductase (DUF2520 family)
MTTGTHLTVSVVGAGVVGSALARRLRESGHRIDVIASRSRASAESAVRFVGGGSVGAVGDAARADVVLVTTPDRVVAEIGEALAASPGLRAGAVVVHASGALASDVLAPVRARGARTASMHPLQSFARREEALDRIAGSAFFCEGEALDVALALAADAGGIPIPIRSEGKVLYHAGAALLSNGLVALAAGAVDLFESAGVDRAAALAALVKLAEGTLANLGAVGLPRALTGPVARGDVGIVRAHVSALRERAPDIAALYIAVAERQVDLAIAKGTIDARTAGELRSALARGDGA